MDSFAAIVDNKGKTYKLADLPKVTAFYFSAHWCPPCRAFTPQLASFYEKVNAGGKKFEVVFVSLDSDQNQFDEYFKTMPWLAVDYSDEQREDIATNFKVQGIPFLALADKNGKPVNGVAIRGDVTASAKVEDVFAKWALQYK